MIDSAPSSSSLGASGAHVRIASSHECAAILAARCKDIAETRAPTHPLSPDNALLLAPLLREGTAHKWSELLCERIRESWSVRPSSLVWLDDKVQQVARTQALCEWHEPLHVPTLATLDADAPEHPTRERTWHAVRELVRTLLDSNDDPRGLVVKPRHGHDAIGVSVWTARALSGLGLDEATSRVWQSLEQAMACFDDSWSRECWQVSAVPRGAIVQPLYACVLEVGTDCPALNTTTCDVHARQTVVRAQREAAAGGAPPSIQPQAALCEVGASEAGQVVAAAPAASAAAAAVAASDVAGEAAARGVRRRVRSNQAAFPIELRVHVFMGALVGASVRSHSNELWITHDGTLVVLDDFRALALARGAKRARPFLLRGAAAARGAGSGAGDGHGDGQGAERDDAGHDPHAALHPLVAQLAALLHAPAADGATAGGAWVSRVVPLSERLCTAAGVEELRVDWLLGDGVLGPRIGETTYMGAAFAGVPALSEAAAHGLMHCVQAYAARPVAAGGTQQDGRTRGGEPEARPNHDQSLLQDL